MDLRRTLETLFHHDEQARQCEEAFLGASDKKDLGRLLSGVSEELLSEGEGAFGRLERLASLLARVPGVETIDVLFTMLGHSSPRVREAAGEALIEAASEHFALIHDRSTIALSEVELEVLSELPYVLVEFETPEIVDLLMSFLGHEDPRVVASALEVTGELAFDERIRAALAGLEGDERVAVLDDETGGHVEVTVGEMASEVLEALRATTRI
jgi:HEAT repeat protein